MRIARGLLLGLAATTALTGSSVTNAHASLSVRLRTTLAPERLGRPTSVGLKVLVDDPGNRLPPPLSRLEVSYPQGLGVALSGLGLVTCSPVALAHEGPSACPSQSWLGAGRAVAEVPIGPVILRETANVAIVRAPGEGQMSLLLYVTGDDPIISEATLSGVLETARPPFGGSIDIALPLLSGLPGGPDVSVVSLTATLGPRTLTYYDRVGQHFVPYRPRGVTLPRHCPAGGFPFAGRFFFADGSSARARTSVPCPGRH